MSNCSSKCPTPGAHATFGACMRAKNVRLGDVGGGGIAKGWDSDLNAYADARSAGIQPSGIDRNSVDRAVRISQEDGVAFRG
jgi:hypothetical protein